MKLKVRDALPFGRENIIPAKALADALGVTSQAVSRWEASGSYPDMEMIPSIAHYFGISIDVNSKFYHLFFLGFLLLAAY